MWRLLAALAALPLQALSAQAPAPRVGEVHEIHLERSMTESGTDGSEGSSNEQDMIVERVLAVSEAGVTLEFDLQPGTTVEDRARQWQFPMRVLRPPSGPLRLLNGPELEARVARWLERASWPRSMCGRMIFTWNAFRIECEPQAAVRGLALIDLPATALRDGAPYGDQTTLAPAALRRAPLPSGGAAYSAELAIDPEAAQRAQAEAEALTEALSGDDPTRRAEWRAFLATREPRRFSGTVRIRFETDPAGRVLRRTKVTELLTERADGVRETRQVTETIERRPVPPSR